MQTFPDHGDPMFQQKLSSLQEYQFFGIPPVNFTPTSDAYDVATQNMCSGFEKTLFQHMVQHYMSYRSPYRGILLFHGLGVGKTCSSITIAEALLEDHNSRMEPRVWVVLPTSLQKPYEEQLFNTAKVMDVEYIKNQCMSDTYRRMVTGVTDVDQIRKKIHNIIKSRYQMFTYEGFATEVEKRGGVVSDKVIIVDEAHNLRIQETDKKAAQALMDVATKGNNNRIVLLSATPMYNEPDEIFWLLSILCANDKRKCMTKKLPSLYTAKGTRSQPAFDLLKQLSQEYISYIKGTNPFTFAARLSPKDSGVATLETKGGWEKSIKDGLVPTQASTFQLDVVKKIKGGDTSAHQALNISYPSGSSGKVGEKGFWSVFKRDVDTDPIQVSYVIPKSRHLYPTADKLGVIAPKILRICDFVRKSEGIVVIYSQFIWSGVIPVAVALEHMGFKRYGAPNILKQRDVLENHASYPGIPFPSYCVLSSDVAIMGNTKIEDMLRDINNPANKHGEKIKVVIMSPVAGEGLSMRNIREVHILDPWYHLNRLDQVIGRAFRTCHHNTLPVEDRNVTVFIHVATNDKMNTTDLNSYQIAARKAKQTEEVETIVRDSAVDCPLLKNVNYFPKSLFGFDVVLRSSQGVAVPYHFGDDIGRSPGCIDPTTAPDASSVRKEVYKNLIPTGIKRLRKYLLSNSPRIYFTTQEMQDAIAMHPTVAKSVLHDAIQNNNFLGNGRALHMHHYGFVIRDTPTTIDALKVKFIKRSETEVKPPDECDRESVIASLSITDKPVGKLLIYKALDSKCWSAFAKKMVKYGSDLPPSIEEHVRLLYSEGAFVATGEIPRFRAPAGAPYIGFVDIFDTAKLSIILYDHLKDVFREATDTEMEILKRNRREVQKPKNNDTLYGTVEPRAYTKKVADSPLNNEVKIWLPGLVARNRKGVVCESLRKNDTMRYINELGANVSSSLTKEQVCFSLAVTLAAKDKLYFLPTLKPT
jgi:hypothetical protein